ncbi:hypothetical protein D3C71_2104570 [compost metagenome]
MQQRANPLHRNHQIRLFQHIGAQPGIEQQAHRIEAGCDGHLTEIGKASGTNQEGHGQSAGVK